MPKISFLVVLIVVLGGTIFSSEKAVPGNFLYFVKVHLNEPAMELAAFGDKREALLQTKLIGRRLEEAESLFLENSLTAGRIDELLGEIRADMDGLQDRTDKLVEKHKTADVSEVHSAYEVVLETHGERLTRLISASPQDKTAPGREILSIVQEKLAALFDERRTTETKEFAELGPDSLAAAENAQKIARAKIDDATTFVNSRKTAVSLEVFVRATEKIKSAEAAFAEGSGKIEAAAYRDAFALFKKSEREEEAAKLLFSMAVTPK